MRTDRGERTKIISIEAEGKVPIMNTSSLKEALEKAGLTRQEPILSKKTELYGNVDLYAPDTDPKDWAKGCWYLVTDTNPEDKTPMIWALKCGHAYEAYERPHFISDHQLFIPEIADYVPPASSNSIEL